MRTRGPRCRRSPGDLHELVRALVEVPVPVVAVVRGWAAEPDEPCAGRGHRGRGGVDAAAPRLPGDRALPGRGPDLDVPRAVGAARARHILLTDRVIAADEALALGLVAMVVADDDVAAEAEALARRLAEGPVRALGRTKSLLRADRTLSEQLDAEAAAIAESVADEGREGIAAFR